MANVKRQPGDQTKRYNLFCEHIQKKSKVLVLGLASKDDAEYFRTCKYQVTVGDVDEELVKSLTSQDFEGKAIDLKNMPYQNEFDGVYCSKLLLDAKKEEVVDYLREIKKACKIPGTIFVSFNYKSGIEVDEFVIKEASVLLGLDLLDVKVINDATNGNHLTLDVLLLKK